MKEKTEAYKFFRDLEGYLNSALPDHRDMFQRIPEIVATAKGDPKQRHKVASECAFLNHYVLPNIFKHISRWQGMDEEKARKSLLSEFYRNMKEITSGTPARSLRDPFGKALGVSATKVMSQWWGEAKGTKLIQSCPDFALRNPFPHKTVFEGKYFSKGSLGRAERELVTALYEAFFYRGLSYAPETKTHPAWDYDYACLLTFDASEKGDFLEAWESLDTDVKKGFWEGANIYVMILRGQEYTGEWKRRA